MKCRHDCGCCFSRFLLLRTMYVCEVYNGVEGDVFHECLKFMLGNFSLWRRLTEVL